RFCGRTRSRRTRRSGRRCRGTSAAAPATGTSSRLSRRHPMRRLDRASNSGSVGFADAGATLMSTTTVETAPVEVQAPAKKWQGQNVPRKEDKRLTQGQGVFVDDVKRHGMGYLHFVRSPYAHAHITSIDVSKAEEIKGVYGTMTGEEVASLTDPFFQLSTPPGAHLKDYSLA